MLLSGIINGIVMGGVISLPVLGIAVIYGMTGIPNFAIGTIGVFCAFTTWYYLDYNRWLAILLGVALSFAIGYALQRFLLTPISERREGDLTLFFIITISLGMMFTGLTRVIFPQSNIALSLPYSGNVTIAGVTTSGLKIVALCFGLGCLGLLHGVEHYTDTGKSWRATSQNLRLAKLLGVNTNRAFSIASGIGCTLAAVGAILWGSIYNLTLASGWDLTFLGYIIAVLGGVGNVFGGMLAALLMGMVLSFSGYFLGGTWQTVILYAIVIFVLMVAPKGLLGSERSV